MKHPQYNPELTTAPLSDNEIDQLDELLAALPGDEVMDVETLDGYLTALLVTPTLPPPDVWIPRVWGGVEDGPPPFASGKQTKKFVQLVLRQIAAIDRTLKGDFAQFEPWFGIAEGEEDDVVDAQLWCSGFLFALELTQDQWQADWDEPEVALALRPIALLGGDELAPADAELVATAAQRDEWSRQVPDSVEALYRHWRPLPASDEVDSDDATDADTDGTAST